MEQRNPNSWPARAPRAGEPRPGLFTRLWQDESAPVFGLVVRTAWLWWPFALAVWIVMECRGR